VERHGSVNSHICDVLILLINALCTFLSLSLSAQIPSDVLSTVAVCVHSLASAQIPELSEASTWHMTNGILRGKNRRSMWTT
jgi:hypothetical protein